MKRILIPALILILFAGAKRKALPPPSGLMTEFIREPDFVKIADPKPEFSWIVPDEAVKQTAWQILVSSSREKLAKNEVDLWNSGITPGSKSTEIEYRGALLEENSVCFWKVRIWDRKGNPTGYSEIQSFRTGKFETYATTRNRFLTASILPVKILKIGPESFFIDFGKAAFARLEFELSPVEKDTLVIHLGEKTDGSRKIDRNPGGTIRYRKILLPLEPGKSYYNPELPPDARNTGPTAIHLPDSVGVLMPFRYVEIENCRYDLKPENIKQKAYWYYFNDTMSSFESSDTILNKVWDLCKYTIKATSFAGIYIDGDRERIPYEADAYINQLAHYYTDREYSLARLTNEYFITHPTWPTEWILHTVPMFYNDLMFTGNFESASHYYEALKHKTLLSLARNDGLISSANVTDEIMKSLGFSDAKERLRDIVDWPPSQKDTGWKLATPEGERDGYEMVEINTVVNAFHYHNLVLMAEVAVHLGKDIDAVLYRRRAEQVKKSINEKLLDKSKGIYVDGEGSDHSSLHANMIALAFDLVQPENLKTVIDFIKSRGMACSVYGAQYLLEGLYKAGESDYALSLLTATHDRSWWNMIRTGSTITMEAWDVKYKPNSDWNHAWGSAPANIIPGYMWGIRPLSPGYAKAVIKPQPAWLKFCRIEVPTIRGNIKAEYRISDNNKEYTIYVPANIECEFWFTDPVSGTVKLNGRKVMPEKNALPLQPGINRLIIPGCQPDAMTK